MKSLLREPKSREDTYVMEDEQTQRLLGEMQSDIRHLQSDVTDIKADQRIRFDKTPASKKWTSASIRSTLALKRSTKR
jgi:hypothetical protein